MARNHVGEQSDRQRERADNQQLKQLNRGQQNIDRGRNALREDLVPQEVAKALFTDAGNPVLAETPHGEHQRQRDGRACRDVEARDDAAQIEDQQRAEHGGDHRHITLATQLAHHLIDDVVADKLDQPFDCALPTARDELCTACRNSENQQHDDGRKNTNEDDAVDGERRALKNKRIGKEVIDARHLWTIGDGHDALSQCTNHSRLLLLCQLLV